MHRNLSYRNAFLSVCMLPIEEKKICDHYQGSAPLPPHKHWSQVILPGNYFQFDGANNAGLFHASAQDGELADSPSKAK